MCLRHKATHIAMSRSVTVAFKHEEHTSWGCYSTSERATDSDSLEAIA